MAIIGEWISYGDSIGYLALPDRAQKPLPAVIVIQEVWGVEDHIEDVTRRIAAAGYAALAPDLYAPGGRRPEALSRERVAETMALMGAMAPATRADPKAREAELAKLPSPQAERVAATFAAAFSFVGPGRLDALLPGLRSAFRHLRTENPATRGQRIGCVGFCMGGGLSALLSCEEEELSAAAIYYGSAPPTERIAKVACPLIGFYGANDARLMAGLPVFEAAMSGAGKSFEKHIYEGAGHAFLNDTGPAYEVKAARDSWSRLLGFFARTLSP